MRQREEQQGVGIPVLGRPGGRSPALGLRAGARLARIASRGQRRDLAVSVPPGPPRSKHADRRRDAAVAAAFVPRRRCDVLADGCRRRRAGAGDAAACGSARPDLGQSRRRHHSRASAAGDRRGDTECCKARCCASSAAGAMAGVSSRTRLSSLRVLGSTRQRSSATTIRPTARHSKRSSARSACPELIRSLAPIIRRHARSAHHCPRAARVVAEGRGRARFSRLRRAPGRARRAAQRLGRRGRGDGSADA